MAVYFKPTSVDVVLRIIRALMYFYMETIHRLPVDTPLLGQQESATKMMFKDIHLCL